MGKDIRRYIIYTFSFSWLFWGIAIFLTQTHIAEFGNPLMLIPYMLGGLSPAICETYIKRKYSSKSEFKYFVKNIINPRHHVVWYILIIVSAFTCCFLPTLFGGASKVLPLYMAFLEMPLMIVGGGLEEIGWRGFLQPTLQKKMPAFLSVMIISCVWAVWHLPLWFILGTSQMKLNFLTFFITATALSLILAALFNFTHSVFLCIIMHAFINGFWNVFQSNDKVLPALSTFIFCFIIFIMEEVIRKGTGLLKKYAV